jgi:hypothetical protein
MNFKPEISDEEELLRRTREAAQQSPRGTSVGANSTLANPSGITMRRGKIGSSH